MAPTNSNNAQTNTRSESTTFEWKRVKMRRPAGGHTKTQPKAGHSYFRRLSPWNWRRQPITLAVKYRGGSECWFEIHARGGTLRVPGVVALVDVVKEIANQDA